MNIRVTHASRPWTSAERTAPTEVSPRPAAGLDGYERSPPLRLFPTPNVTPSRGEATLGGPVSPERLAALYPKLTAFDRDKLAASAFYNVPTGATYVAPAARKTLETKGAAACDRVNARLNEVYGTSGQIYVPAHAFMANGLTEGMAGIVGRASGQYGVPRADVTDAQLLATPVSLFHILGDDCSAEPEYIGKYSLDLQRRIAAGPLVEKAVDHLNYAGGIIEQHTGLDLPSLPDKLAQRYYVTVVDKSDDGNGDIHYLTNADGKTGGVHLDDALEIHATIMGVNTHKAFECLQRHGLTQATSITEEWRTNPRFPEIVALFRHVPSMAESLIVESLAKPGARSSYPGRSLFEGATDHYRKTAMVKAACVHAYPNPVDRTVTPEFDAARLR